MVVRLTKHLSTSWLLLVTNLPGTNKTLRMRIWRALKSAGAGTLRDGVYVLPQSDGAKAVFAAQASEIQAGGGSTHLFAVPVESADQHKTLAALFDRTGEYAQSIHRLNTLKGRLTRLREPEARQHLASVAREVSATVARDFFPGEPREQMQDALADTERAINERFAPDEPHPAHRRILPRDGGKYRGRTWATRQHLWIDRVASAWLIRRFIDPHARFVWLKHIKECPKHAVGFDFDGAEFSHVGSKVTFEVLVAGFALDQNMGLVRLGALVHHLDVGGIPIAEGPGLATIMAGARKLQPDDEALLKAMTPVLDSLYAGYASASQPRFGG
jgi:hypothetical protein